MSQSVDAAMSRARGEEKELIADIRGATGKWERQKREEEEEGNGGDRMLKKKNVKGCEGSKGQWDRKVKGMRVKCDNEGK